MICVAPLMLVGYLFTLQTPSHHSTLLNGAVIELQTCETGLGAHIKASSSGLYASGIQYGLTWQITPKWSMTLSPRLGLSYVDHPVYELPMRTQFELGTQLLFGYDRWRGGVGYWHLSNGGMKDPNIGVDLLEVLTGWRF